MIQMKLLCGVLFGLEFDEPETRLSNDPHSSIWFSPTNLASKAFCEADERTPSNIRIQALCYLYTFHTPYYGDR